MPFSSVTNFLLVTSYNSTSTPSFAFSSLSLWPFSFSSIQTNPEIEYFAFVFSLGVGVGVGVGVSPPSTMFPSGSIVIILVVFGRTNVFWIIFDCFVFNPSPDTIAEFAISTLFLAVSKGLTFVFIFIVIFSLFFIFKLIFNLADLELSPPFASAISTFPNFLFSLVIVYFVSENFPSFFTSKLLYSTLSIFNSLGI